MPHSKFNWRSTPAATAQNSDGSFGFAFGDTWKLTDHTLVKPENAKGCTLDGTSLFFPRALSDYLILVRGHFALLGRLRLLVVYLRASSHLFIHSLEVFLDGTGRGCDDFIGSC
jgi:hypothetical protein